jgi:hypothetical protein
MSDNYISGQTAKFRAQNKFEEKCTPEQEKELSEFYDFVKKYSGRGLFIARYPVSGISDDTYYYLKSLILFPNYRTKLKSL